jgi:hypothetical protein
MKSGMCHLERAGWKAFKEGIDIDAINKPWICVNLEGKSFSSLKAAKAKDSLILPAAASPPGMAAANASLAQHPEISKTELSQMETIISQMAMTISQMLASISQLRAMLRETRCDIGTTESENAKPAAKPSVAKPAAKSTKAKKATKLAVKKATRPILSFFDQQDARVSLDGPSFSSAVAVTTKKGKGKKRTLLDSDDEYELSCELSSSPDFLCKCPAIF